ncbi:MAG: YfcE family phosphodiesterase [Dehalococcoidia bacterium]
MMRNGEATKLAVFSDTHVRNLQQLDPVVMEALREADWVAHCGDFTGLELVEELRERYPRFVGVYGNSDPDSVRQFLPRKRLFRIGRWRIGMTHPYWGVEPDGIEEKVLRELGSPDIILFGHTHERVESYVGNTLLVNPGPGYAEFMTPGSVAVLSLRRDSVEVEFHIFER